MRRNSLGLVMAALIGIILIGVWVSGCTAIPAPGDPANVRRFVDLRIDRMSDGSGKGVYLVKDTLTGVCYMTGGSYYQGGGALVIGPVVPCE